MKKCLLSVLAFTAATQLVACGSSNDATVRLSWAITVNGAPGTCGSVGATTVRVIADRGGRTTTIDFSCSASSGGEFDINRGSYDFEIQLLDGTGLQLNTVDVLISRDILAGEDVNLGTFEFSFNLSFNASFRVHMGSAEVTGGNCSSTTSNGAGIAFEQIRIYAGNQCLPYTLSGVINESNQPFTTSTCDDVICQPNSVVHVVEGLTPGNYEIEVAGYKGATGATAHACYYSLSTPFSITSTDVNLGEIFAPFDPLPADDVFCNATKPEGA